MTSPKTLNKPALPREYSLKAEANVGATIVGLGICAAFVALVYSPQGVEFVAALRGEPDDEA